MGWKVRGGNYGITGYGISSPEIQNQKDFCIKINIPKGNYWILRIGLMVSLSSWQKSDFLKLIISFFHYFWCQNWDQRHKMSGKNTHIYFFYFRFKNKRVWAEKFGKIRKKFKNLPLNRAPQAECRWCAFSSQSRADRANDRPGASRFFWTVCNWIN